MRQALSASLVDLARRNPKVLLLTGDHGYALFDEFRKHCPGQYVNAGVAEQNMVGMAAGLSRVGYFPIVYGLSAFVPVRVLEQIKLDVCHDDLPVIFLGDGAGFVYSALGTSHQSTEDIAATRAIPNLCILSPADRHEMDAVMRMASESGRPAYIRIGKSDLGDVHPGPVTLTLGDMIQVRKTESRVSFIATGSMVKTAVELAGEFNDASVWSVPTIKPLNLDQLSSCLQTSRLVVTFEEHSVYGGLGGLIAELSAETHPVRVLRIGVSDRFSELCGSYRYLLKEHGLDIGSIRARIRDYVATSSG